MCFSLDIRMICLMFSLGKTHAFPISSELHHSGFFPNMNAAHICMYRLRFFPFFVCGHSSGAQRRSMRSNSLPFSHNINSYTTGYCSWCSFPAMQKRKETHASTCLASFLGHKMSLMVHLSLPKKILTTKDTPGSLLHLGCQPGF